MVSEERCHAVCEVDLPVLAMPFGLLDVEHRDDERLAVHRVHGVAVREVESLCKCGGPARSTLFPVEAVAPVD